jgi:hypothetical protein
MGTTSDKLTYLNETKNLLRQGINAIGGEIETADTFRSYVDELENIYEELPKVTGSGTSVTLDNTRKGGLRVELNPTELEQFTTTGKNILDITSLTSKTSSGLTITRTNDKISITGKRNATGWVELVNFTLPVGTYTFSFIATGTNPVDPKVLEGYTQKTNTFTVSDSTQTYRIAISGAIDDEWNCVLQLQLETGSDATSYEPYTNGASPNPSYPQQIHTISGNNQIVVEGLNLLPTITTQTVNGITITNNGDGSYKLNGTATANTYFDFFAGTFDSSTSVGYYLKEYNFDNIKTIMGVSSSSPLSYRISTSNRTSIQQVNGNTIGGYVQIEDNGSNLYLAVRIHNGGSLSNVIIKPMLVKTSSDLDKSLQPYQEQVYPINLGDIEYCKIGDYQDEFLLTSGKNLFDNNATPYDTSKYINGATGVITGAGEFSIYKINVEENTTYTITNSGLSSSPGVCYYDSSNTRLGGMSYDSTANITITTPSYTSYILVSVVTQTSSNRYDLNYFQIEKGNVATSYEPYGNNLWYLKKNIRKVVLNGTESNFYYTSDVGETGVCGVTLFTTDMLSGNYLDGLSNYFLNKKSGKKANTIRFGASSSSIYMYLNNTIITSLSDFTTWLSTHNTDIYYILSTPTYTLLNETLQTQLNNLEKALSYKEQTNLSQVNNDLEFNMLASALESFEE